MFSTYVSNYQYGQCKSWIDKDSKTPAEQCITCESRNNCSSCLATYGCGWCFDPSNPIEGKCESGNFEQSTKCVNPVSECLNSIPVVRNNSKDIFWQNIKNPILTFLTFHSLKRKKQDRK